MVNNLYGNGVVFRILVFFVGTSVVFVSFGVSMRTGDQSLMIDETRDIIWDVEMNFNEPGGAFDWAIFGEAPDANDGPPFDSYDVPKPPPSIPPYIYCWFDDGIPEPFNKLWKDYRFYPDIDKQWNLSIQWWPSDYVTPTTITISWNTNDVDDAEYMTVGLYDSSYGFLKNMLNESSYTFICPAIAPQFYYIICQDQLLD